MKEGADLTEDEAFERANKLFKGRALLSSERIRTADGVTVIYQVGDIGDATSATIAGQGFSWREALANASAPTSRRRPASTEQYRGGLDIGQPYARKERK